LSFQDGFWQITLISPQITLFKSFLAQFTPIFAIGRKLCHTLFMPSKRTKFREIKKRLATGEILRLGKGVYAKPQDLEGLEGDFFQATLLCGKPSAICLHSALKYYGLSDQMHGGIWILIPHAKSPPRKKAIKTIRTRNPRWKIGITNHSRYKITDLERTLVDCFRHHRLVGISTAVQALKLALKEKKTTKNKVFSMAEKLNAPKLLQPYLDSM
jgi:predicted transcriptional regulator of viral defense system